MCQYFCLNKVPSKFEEIWCPRGGDFPNSRFVRKAKYSSSYSLPLCFESTRKYSLSCQPPIDTAIPLTSTLKSITNISSFMIFFFFRLRSIRSTLVRVWVRKWPKRTSVSSPKSSCAPTKGTSVCRPVTTKAPVRPASDPSATLDTCETSPITGRHWRSLTELAAQLHLLIEESPTLSMTHHRQQQRCVYVKSSMTSQPSPTASLSLILVEIVVELTFFFCAPDFLN